ncbi:MAG TPA: 4-(cytidine 5'-diphospho)-2-C-methyl-D-erythritol kinase [Longimicrobium sp.]
MPERLNAVTLDAPAKVNLRLRILAREESGYHSLETLFCALSLADEVGVARGGPGIRLRVEGGVDTGPPEKNLALRAAERFYRELGEEAAVDLHLVKRIPSAAGLGGGSSDAAAVLRALNALHGGIFPRTALLQMAAELGSDVPFFACGSPLALAWGRGERLLPLPPLPPRPVLVAHPGQAMPTADAFRRVAELRGGTYRPRATLLDPQALVSWDAVAALAGNDFEPVVVERIPVLADALAGLRAEGARIALLAGSGSSVFGVFEGEAERERAAARLEALGMRCWRARTLDAEPAPVPG